MPPSLTFCTSTTMEPEVISTPPGINLLEPCVQSGRLGLGAGFTRTSQGWRGPGGGGVSPEGLGRTFDFDGDDAAVGGSVLDGVRSVAVDTGLAVETRSSSSSPVPFPPGDLTQMSERRWVGGSGRVGGWLRVRGATLLPSARRRVRGCGAGRTWRLALDLCRSGCLAGS